MLLEETIHFKMALQFNVLLTLDGNVSSGNFHNLSVVILGMSTPHSLMICHIKARLPKNLHLDIAGYLWEWADDVYSTLLPSFDE